MRWRTVSGVVVAAALDLGARLISRCTSSSLVERERDAALERRAEPREHRVERRRLTRRAREAVEDEAAPRVGSGETLLGHGDHDVVGHEVAARHHRLRLRPTAVFAATASRSISPVEICGTPSFCTSSCAWVPLPAPGGPSMRRRARAHRCKPAADPRALREALVLARHEVRLDLRDRVEPDADHDQERRAAVAERQAHAHARAASASRTRPRCRARRRA
jgi:hypothetical protein